MLGSSRASPPGTSEPRACAGTPGACVATRAWAEGFFRAVRSGVSTTAVLMLLAAGPATPVAQAHDVSYAHAELVWSADSVHVALTVHAHDAAMVLRVPMPEWFEDPAFVGRAGHALSDSLATRFELRSGARGLSLRFQGAHPDAQGRGVTLELVAALPPSATEIEFVGPVFPEMATHQTYVTITRGGEVRAQEVLTATHRSARAFASGAPGVLAVWRTFVASGVRHIAIGPDHILFIVGLLLLGGGLWPLLGVVTSFTLAHSVTLALAALGVVRLPARFIEPVIALSIVVVALETLRSRARGHDHRRALAFGFGLVHGFGFASVLADFGLPRAALGHALAAFNVGVELGQGVLVLALAPLLSVLARRAPHAHARVVTLAAIGIAAAGGYWCVQRLITP